ncbi:MAG: MFS transporter [Hyphomonadaceae bacterium]|jgi:MFS family permease
MMGDRYPTARAGWTLTVMLTIAYIFSYLDRNILGLLIGPIKQDLGLRDDQLGYVIGPAFAIFYATMGLPFGWLADRVKRTRLVSAGIAFWSLATAVTGFVTGFWQLFAARMAVGIGEAVLSPSAMSLIGDSFPEEKRARPVAFYSAALSLAVGLSAIATWGIISWAKGSATIAVPLLGDLKPWQFSFVAVGLPGLLIALIFLLLPEPPRQPAVKGEEGNGVRDAARLIGGNWQAYLGVILLVCVMTTVTYGQGSFGPAAFNRAYGWPTEIYALYNGIGTMIVGPGSLVLTSWLIMRMQAKGMSDAPYQVSMWAFILMVVLCTLPFLVNMPVATLALNILSTIPLSMLTAGAMLALLAITPSSVRGQVVALYYVAINITGLFLGPTTVGWLSTNLFGEANLRWAIAILPVIFGVIPLILLPAIGRAYRLRLAALEPAST